VDEAAGTPHAQQPPRPEPQPAPQAVPPVVGPEDVLPGEARVFRAASESLRGERRGLRAAWPFLGPAFIASVAYVDPGNFATNMAGGAKFGYLLLWVIVAANLMAMLVQSMSAKLGIATGKNLPEVCRDRFSRPVTTGLWLQAEAIAMATDLAEFLGAALGLNLLFHIPLFVAGLITGVIAFGILALQARGFRRLEAVIAGLVGAIVLSFGAQVFMAKPDVTDTAGGLVPGFSGRESVLLAVGILGATVMPHVIYLHSALTQHRIVGASDEMKRKIFRFELVDVVVAMGLAGVINAAMLITAAAVFHTRGLVGVGDDLRDVYDGLGAHIGGHANILFGIALLASGLSSSSVGTMAGQVVMQGFVRRQIPLLVRRTVTMLPALVVLAVGLDPSRSLVISQVVLSFGIPFALIPLLLFCRDRTLMGVLVNRRSTTVVATVVATVIVVLNVFLLEQTFVGS
jgi:manganese transport protein